MSAFNEVGSLDGWSVGDAMLATSGLSTVALFKLASGVYATEPWCLRCGALLTDGALDGATVACVGCDWRYDVTTGCVIGVPSLRLKKFDVRVENGRIFVAGG